MIRFLKFTAIVTLLAILFILISGLFLSREYYFEKSILIQAPQSEVWKNVSMFSNIEKWSPLKLNGAKGIIEGEDGQEGASYSWLGNQSLGKGKQTIRNIQSPNAIAFTLEFEEPIKSNADLYFSLDSVDSKRTKITWRLKGNYSYPINAIAYFFLDMDYELNKSFASGLVNLKKLCESSTLLTTFNYKP